MSIMGFFRGLLMTIDVITAALLLILILMQRSKSQGIGVAFGSAMGESLFGAQMGNVLTKATVILAVVFLTTTTILAMLGPSRGTQDSLSGRLSTEVSAEAAVPRMPPAQNTGALPVDSPVAAAPMEAPEQPLRPVEVPNTLE